MSPSGGTTLAPKATNTRHRSRWGSEVQASTHGSDNRIVATAQRRNGTGLNGEQPMKPREVSIRGQNATPK
jgi:hypothetical protein